MFFKLHAEYKIGIKLLTKADLGLGTSHQTHIGLYDGIFTFLSDKEEEKSALFIYDDKVDIVDCYFDRIQNPNKTFRSPKIKKGGRNTISIVTIIRDKAKEHPNYKWYLIWFALDGEEMVFYVFSDHSKDFSEISNIINLENQKKRNIEVKNIEENSNLLKYLENKINVNSDNIIENIEIATQISSSKKYEIFNLDNLKNKIKEIGKKGELIINEYFNKLKSEGKISTFNWFNKNDESGLPYDFTLQYSNEQVVYLDVKSTLSTFDQSIIFSNQEIDFIVETPNYHIYRVYDLNLKDNIISPKLRICKDSKLLANEISKRTETFKNQLAVNDVMLESSKVGVIPNNKLLVFENEIILKL